MIDLSVWVSTLVLLAVLSVVTFVLRSYYADRHQFQRQSQEMDFRHRMEAAEREELRLVREFSQRRDSSEINHRHEMDKLRAAHNREMDKLRLEAMVKCHALSVSAGGTDTLDALDQLEVELEEACQLPTTRPGPTTSAS